MGIAVVVVVVIGVRGVRTAGGGGQFVWDHHSSSSARSGAEGVGNVAAKTADCAEKDVVVAGSNSWGYTNSTFEALQAHRIGNL